ncbi:urea ABC transporter permease subunit UrtB [Piscinibacter sakaiensis]|uniref:urea ABC transporter permease subunit UrtB n=1 Tax=Piscinibacter sakaiensis TaxID=1547922 RepID=UPI003AB09CA7
MKRQNRLLDLLRAMLLMFSLAAVSSPASALNADDVHAMTIGDSDERIATINKVAIGGDPGAQAFFEALLGNEVQVAGDEVFIVRDGKAVDAASGAPRTLPADADDVINNNRLRGEIKAALASLKLLSADIVERQQAVKTLQEAPDEARLPLLDKALESETDARLKSQIGLLRAAIMVSSQDRDKRLKAAVLLEQGSEPSIKALLLERLQPDVETDPEVRTQLKAALSSLETKLAWGESLGIVFTGISLGSILVLVALGLAITYGLMGVINMAHGELMMIGAYATYVVQNLFRTWLPDYFDAYVLVAIPVSFLAAAFVGAVLERGVIRWLYGRPLETLLATWGISLVLMQAVRSIFGAQNVPVENPSWLSGGVEVLSNLTLPYNRIAIIVFAILVFGGLTYMVSRTRLGLFVRGVTQNRKMAACMGVNTARVDTSAFALGSGIAGLAGCALSQVGNVGPDLGQGYIVDSFMVVVLGGVGQLIGTVYAALGLGIINKLLEDWTGAVLAKIFVLVLIVIFIQKRPQGLFAMKGRSAEA